MESGGVLTCGTSSFQNGRFDGGGLRYLRFGQWLKEIILLGNPAIVFYEEVRRHMSTDAAHVHGGLLAVMQAELEAEKIPYMGIPVQTIKKFATGKGNAKKDKMIEAAKAKWPRLDIVDDNCADALWILETGKSV